VRITIAVHGSLQRTSTVGREEMTITVPDHGSFRIRDLLENLYIVEDEIKQIIVNGRRDRLDGGLRNRMRLEFFPRGGRPTPRRDPVK
jgi:hypothetical protein